MDKIFSEIKFRRNSYFSTGINILLLSSNSRFLKVNSYYTERGRHVTDRQRHVKNRIHSRKRHQSIQSILLG